jgi:uncharacterized membrane protein
MQHHGKFCHESPQTGHGRAQAFRKKTPDMVQEKTYTKALSSRSPDAAARDMLDKMSAEPPTTEPHTHEFVASVVIARPRHELYAFWRDFTNAPKFMARVDAVTEVDSLSSMWTVKDGAGHPAQWEMLVTDDEPDHLIAWSTSGNSPVSYSGRVEFQDAAGEGTEVTARVRHVQHPGLVETLIEAVAGAPAEQAPPVQSSTDLDRFKEYMERRAPI